ncbi:MAG: hypothetical protein QM809_01600 [Gordonia sp. (in: high G+C Gram-positive bacteria)]|uniref:hypothetical protein n=1 Tax=Gordonia sp. (in: high G+C Gram-positive bacteria) TaxID=84139 RepID=UPI0039E58808
MSDRRTATEAPAKDQRRFAAAVAAVAGVLTVAFSFLPWMHYAPFGENAKSGPAYLRGWPGTLPDGLPYGGVSPAAWTAVLGAIVAVCGGLLLTVAGRNRRVGRIVSGTAVVAAVAGFGALCFFLSDPQTAFDLQAGRIGLNVFLTAAWGMWLEFLCLSLAVVASITAAVLAIRGDAPDDTSDDDTSADA